MDIDIDVVIFRKEGKGMNVAVLIFGYNRPEKLSATINSLLNNEGYDQLKVHTFVFIDSCRSPDGYHLVEKTFNVAREVLPDAHVHLRESNFGLKKSIVSGISYVFSNLHYDAAIVIEDDLELDKRFINYMCTALNEYKDIENVYQVSGFRYTDDRLGDCQFLDITTSWGWATWRKRWHGFDIADDSILKGLGLYKDNYKFSFPYTRMASKELAREISSWAIRWHFFVQRRRGLVLYPNISLVNNRGFDGSGTHSGNYATSLFGCRYKATSFVLGEMPKNICLDKKYKMELISKFRFGTIMFLFSRLILRLGWKS
ncbi:glycosyltransferase [Vibrio cholerae]|uniref:glycosyltransferase n=1 Tax=Vibrio cholerae TaxID=666 RepID=UPI0021D439AF|nr:glycosyltransferase [Vibrio cholerae]MCU4204659.1 glycosyltransferase [Vibrio cholerae]